MPVFNRPNSKPSAKSVSEIVSAVPSPTRPPFSCSSPVCISPRINVPVVSTTAFARSSSSSMTPTTRPSSTSKSSTVASIISMFVLVEIKRCTSSLYASLSACALGPQTAGPLEVLSILNMMPVASITRAINPPSASISRTICPFPRPPIAGLQLITPIFCASIVTKAITPSGKSDDAAHAASAPACPPPITITSTCRAIILRNTPCV